MVIAVKQEIDYPIIDEAVVKKGMIRFGVGDANGIGAAESKSVCHGANIIPTDRLCLNESCAAFFVFSKTARFPGFHPGPTSCGRLGDLETPARFCCLLTTGYSMSPTPDHRPPCTVHRLSCIRHHTSPFTVLPRCMQLTPFVAQF